MQRLKYLACFTLFFLLSPLQSQDGHVFISNFPVDNSRVDNRVSCIDFDENGLAFVGGRKGVAHFDGTDWQEITAIPNNVEELKKRIKDGL